MLDTTLSLNACRTFSVPVKDATMRGDFDEDEDPDFEPEWEEFDDEEMCVGCQRLGSMAGTCNICGMAVCGSCFEMGCDVCGGPHK